MADLEKQQQYSLKNSGIDPAEPLWKRVPTRDSSGKPLSDFRMIIRGLKYRPPNEIQARIDKICLVLSRYEQVVVFADLNLKISVLWVSVRAESRLDLDIAAEIHHLIPEARLITAPSSPEGF